MTEQDNLDSKEELEPEMKDLRKEIEYFLGKETVQPIIWNLGNVRNMHLLPGIFDELGYTVKKSWKCPTYRSVTRYILEPKDLVKFQEQSERNKKAQKKTPEIEE